jgi:hypothetical protein
MSFVPLRLAGSPSLLKNRRVQRRVQAAAAALFLSASFDVAAQAPILGPSDAFGVDYPDERFTEDAIDRFEVQYDDGQWTSVGIPPVYAAVNGVTTYTVMPTMPPTGNHTVSFRVCNAGACSTSTSPFAFLVPIDGNRSEGSRSGAFTGPVVQVQASHTDNKCLDVSGSSTENGSVVIQWQCHGGDNQVWRIEPADDGHNSRLVSRHSGKCLDVSGESREDGAPVIQWQCHGGANQQWRVEAVGEGYRFVARHSGKCLDVPGSTTDAGAAIIQWQCHGGANQTWLVRER